MKKWGLGGENSFWSVAIAIGFYCLILGISIGSMFDRSTCTGSDFGCFEFWINRYQTLLTAFGVIFAVAIAKAQMDANRRQHVAQIKRSFQEELDAIEIARTSAQSILKLNALDISGQSKYAPVFISIISGHESSLVTKHLPRYLSERLNRCCELTNMAIEAFFSGKIGLESFDDKLQFIQSNAEIALQEADALYNKREQYWS